MLRNPGTCPGRALPGLPGNLLQLAVTGVRNTLSPVVHGGGTKHPPYRRQEGRSPVANLTPHYPYHHDPHDKYRHARRGIALPADAWAIAEQDRADLPPGEAAARNAAYLQSLFAS